MPKTSNISIRLLKMIKRFPELYNSEHDLANDKAHSMVVWDAISHELDVPVNVLKKKWQKLRSSHRERWRSLKGAASLPRDDIFHLMNSMLDVSGGDSPGDEDDSSGCSGPTLSIISEEGRSTRSNSAFTVVAAEKPLIKSPIVEVTSKRVLRSQKRATRSEGPIVEAKKNNRQPFSTPKNALVASTASAHVEKSFLRVDNEPVRTFFESMALTVAKFPQHLQAETKTKIGNIVFEAELELSPPITR